MTNSEAINVINQVRDVITKNPSWTEEARRAVNEAVDISIKAMKAQEWIPCNPLELPKDKKLWVTHDRWGCRYVDEVFWDMTEWSDNISDVVAYMPYVEPEPYREEEG